MFCNSGPTRQLELERYRYIYRYNCCYRSSVLFRRANNSGVGSPEITPAAFRASTLTLTLLELVSVRARPVVEYRFYRVILLIIIINCINEVGSGN